MADNISAKLSWNISSRVNGESTDNKEVLHGQHKKERGSLLGYELHEYKATKETKIVVPSVVSANGDDAREHT